MAREQKKSEELLDEKDALIMRLQSEKEQMKAEACKLQLQWNEEKARQAKGSEQAEQEASGALISTVLILETFSEISSEICLEAEDAAEDAAAAALHEALMSAKACRSPLRRLFLAAKRSWMLF